MKIVAQYTTEDAVNDGNLIPVSSLGDDVAKLVGEVGINVPVYLSREVYSAVATRGADIPGRIWDLLWLYKVYSLGGMYIFDRESGELVLREDHPQPDRITPYTVRIGRKNHKIWGVVEGASVILMHPEEY